MIEPAFYLVIGFLFAGLLAGATVPLVVRRMVRLISQQREAAFQWLRRVQAEKNLLRAEFATSTRNFEVIVEQLKNKIAEQRVELGRNGDSINRLKLERNILKIEINALQTQVGATQAITEPPAAQPGPMFLPLELTERE